METLTSCIRDHHKVKNVDICNVNFQFQVFSFKLIHCCKWKWF